MIREDHRHIFHHTARVILVAFTFGMAVATIFVLLDVLYHEGGFLALVFVFAIILLVPASRAYGRAIEEKSQVECYVCEGAL